MGHVNIESFNLGTIAVLRFAHPPVNTLSVTAGLVSALHERLTAINDDPAIRGVVLTGNGGMFSAGADIAEFDGDRSLLAATRALIEYVAHFPKPVATAIEGICAGGGLELALAAGYRVAAAGAKLGLPEVTLGVLPGAGGTQRLPRLIGAAAIDMLLGGALVDAPRAEALGLIDAVVDGDVVRAAADRLSHDARVERPDRAGEIDAATLAAAERKARLPAAQAILACIRAAIDQPLSAGLEFEAAQFDRLLDTPEFGALRHGFFGRRIASRPPGSTDAKPKNIHRVTVIGSGLMGTGITVALLNAGMSVALVDARAEALDKAVVSITKTIDRDVDKGRLSRAAGDARLASLSPVGSIADGADADLFIEAVFEDMEVKRTVFREIDRVARAGAILASNTSALDLDAIAAFTSRPQDVVGLHFFSPANIMRLLEIVRGSATSANTLATALAFAKRIGKSGVVAGVSDGFIGNRMFEEYFRQAWFLLEEGCQPRQIDRALETWGMAMGPCRVLDLAGQDVGWSVRKRRAIEQPDRPYSRIPDLICERGRFGQKTGAGFYRYQDGRTPEDDPEVASLIEQASRDAGVARRAIADVEIVDRCIYSLVNEGAKIVGEGIAYRPVDVDIVYLDGYGFPAERGGPMYYADRQGLQSVLDRIREFETAGNGWAWKPAPLLTDLVAQGRDFASLNP